MFDIITIGEILIDLTQTGINEQGIPEYASNPGGAPANLAVAAAKLGAKTAFMGKVGNDSFGSYLKECLISNGVDTKGVVTDSVLHTTLAVVSVDKTGERSFSFYRDPGADVNLTKEDIDLKLLTDTKFFHFGSVSLTTDPARSTTLYAVKKAKEAGACISYDPNFRPSLWSNEKEAIRQMTEPLSLVDVIKVSEEELPLLTGTVDAEKGSQILMQKGISLILVTLGEKGAFYRLGTHTGHVPGVPCKVADTNGAGDTFFGAVLAGLSKTEKLQEISTAELERIIAIANKAASITTSRHGAIPAMPTKEEL